MLQKIVYLSCEKVCEAPYKSGHQISKEYSVSDCIAAKR